MRPDRAMRWHRMLAFAQGSYFAVTGLWPLVSLSTFQLVTGPKTDTWLVQTVGVLVLAIAIPLLLAALRGRVLLETRVLGLTSASAFLLVDVVFYAQGRIGTIYLGDALLELVFVIGWLAPGSVGAGRRRNEPFGP